jgi:hypothetical protein
MATKPCIGCGKIVQKPRDRGEVSVKNFKALLTIVISSTTPWLVLREMKDAGFDPLSAILSGVIAMVLVGLVCANLLLSLSPRQLLKEVTDAFKPMPSPEEWERQMREAFDKDEKSKR